MTNNMTNKEIVDLFHRLGKDAKLTYWDWKDDSILFYEDFWSALSDTLQVLGIKVECPLCREEQKHEKASKEKA